MSSAATNTTDDAPSVVALARAVVLAMTDATTILVNLVFIVTEGSIEGRELAQSVSLVVALVGS